MNSFTRLKFDPIVKQMLFLSRRINERFPESGLNAIGKQTFLLSRKIERKHRELSKPSYVIRSVSYILSALILVGIAYTIQRIELPGQEIKLFEFFQVLEAGINDLIFIAIAIYFLFGTETRLRRKKALHALEELRSLIHVIDMHQLSKDPQMLIHKGVETESSPERTYNSFEMGRYLDYCSEMLSLISKMAALYIQDVNDHVILSAANEVESVAANISHKIWQKILLLK